MKTFKITLITCTCLLFIGNQSIAQIMFGVKAGANLSNVKFDRDIGLDISSRIGPNVGLFVEYEIASRISLQAEANYSQMGYRTFAQNLIMSSSTSQFIMKIETERKFNMLAIPLMAKCQFAKFSLVMGPQLSTVISANYVSKISTNNQTATESGTDNRLKSIEASAILGAEYNISARLSTSFRYQHGLTNILKNPLSLYSKEIQKVFSINLAYKIKY